MTPRTIADRLTRLEAKVTAKWMWNVPLMAWPKDQRRLLFAVIAARPAWLRDWPAERHAWLHRALIANPHVFPDATLMAIALPGVPSALPAPPLRLTGPSS